ETAKNVALDAEVETRHAEAANVLRVSWTPNAATFAPGIWSFRCDSRYQVQTVHVRGSARSSKEDVIRFFSDRRVLRAVVAKMSGQLAGIALANANDAVPLEVLRKRLIGAPIRHDGTQVSNDETRTLWLSID